MRERRNAGSGCVSGVNGGYVCLIVTKVYAILLGIM